MLNIHFVAGTLSCVWCAWLKNKKNFALIFSLNATKNQGYKFIELRDAQTEPQNLNKQWKEKEEIKYVPS